MRDNRRARRVAANRRFSLCGSAKQRPPCSGLFYSKPQALRHCFASFPKISQCFRTLRFSGALFAAECRELKGKPTPSRDVGFPLFLPFFRASYYRTGKNSPLSATLFAKRNVQKQKARFLLLRGSIKIAQIHSFRIESQVCDNRAPENRNEVRFLGRGGAECACEHCPKGRCESAADSSDEKV